VYCKNRWKCRQCLSSPNTKAILRDNKIFDEMLENIYLNLQMVENDFFE